ncbi:MAG: HEAT repeat domain-containing protein [Saprospiraceae bacterium]|nr:HEAT repeat domain-containing protein [Saprospiraceae bacterium]
MDKPEINKLKELYKLNELNQDEWKLLEAAIAAGDVLPDELHDLKTIQDQLSSVTDWSTPVFVKDNLLDLIANEKRSVMNEKIGHRRELYIRYALTAAALMAGVIIGFVLPARKAAQNQDIAGLKHEVNQLRETMMLTLLQDEAPTERLKAVSYSEDFDQYNNKIITALFTTLNQDDNINVRLAAIEALQKYTAEAWVRGELVKSIALQSSPLVQVALAECMVSIKEKSSIQELEKVVRNKDTPEPVKKRLESYIKQI